MAEVNTSFFWDSDTQEYGEAEIRASFKSMFRSGVRVHEDGTLDLVPTQSGQTVSIGTGIAFIDGSWHWNRSVKTISFNSPSSWPRIDRIVVREDCGNKVTTLTVLEGTESATPTPPVLTQNEDVLYEISLAQVRVETNGSITMTDERADPTVCGAIRAKGLSEFEAYMTDTKAGIENWFEHQQSQGWRQIYIQNGIPSSPVAGSMCFDTSSGNIYYYTATGTRKTFSIKAQEIEVENKALADYLSPEVFGVNLSSDRVFTGTKQPIPFDRTIIGCSNNTKFAELLSNGSVRIKKKGIYDVRAYGVISDNAVIGDVYQFHIMRNGAIVAESYSPGNGTTAASTVATFSYLNPGDNICLSVGGVAHGWRIKGLSSHIYIAPHVYL